MDTFPQAEKMKAQLASLPPLSMPNMASVMKDGSLSYGVSGTLYRKTDLLLSNLLKMSAGVKVVDITGKTPGECACACVCASKRERWKTIF